MIVPQIATVDEFVAWEDRQERKYELAVVRISPCQSGTLRHEMMIANAIAILHAALGPGRVLESGVKTVTPTSSSSPRMATEMRAQRSCGASLEAYVSIDSRKRWVRIACRGGADRTVSFPFATGEIVVAEHLGRPPSRRRLRRFRDLAFFTS